MAITTIDTLLTSLRTTMAALSELAKEQDVTIEFYEGGKYASSLIFVKNHTYTAKLKLTKEYS